MKEYSKIHCLSCNKEMDNWEYDSHNKKTRVEVHPMGGLHFRTYGHYGSTIFDPMGTGEFLDIAICDECVIKNIKNVRGTGLKDLEETVDILVDAAIRHG